MNADNHEFPGETLYDQGKFEKLFSSVAAKLKLDEKLQQNELRLLRRAFFQAFVCNVAFNGLGGCQGKIRPDRELNRIRLEQTFMRARARLYACRGWQRLPCRARQRLEATLLRVEISEDNLAK